MRMASKSSRGSYAARSSASYSKKPSNVVSNKTKAILLARNTGGIGDMLMLTPVMRAIKEQNPNVPLVVCTTPSYGAHGTLFDILKYNPYVDKIVTVENLMDYEFQKVYDFNTRKEIEIEVTANNPFQSHRVDIFLHLAELETKNKSTVYTVTPGETEWAKGWIRKNVNPKRPHLIGIQVEATTGKRSWGEEKNFLLAFKILNTWPDTSVVFFYEGLVERHPVVYPNIYYLIGLPIRWVAALINECDAIIAPDSGLLHIAGALDKKIVGVFGSTPPDSRLKYYRNATGIYLDYPCSPCWYSICREQYKCMTDIPVDSVIKQLGKTLNREIPDTKNNILVYRMGGLGDLIMLTPSLRALKKYNPDSKLTVATKPEHIAVLKGLPYLDNVVAIGDIDFLQVVVEGKENIISAKDGTDKGFDHIIDLRWKVESPEVGGSLNTLLYQTINRVDMFARLVGVELGDNKKCDVSLDKTQVPKLKKLLKYSRKFKWLGIQSTATSNLRTFPPEFIPELVTKFSKIKNLKVVLFGKSEFWHGRKTNVNLKAVSGDNVVNVMDSLDDSSQLIALISMMDYVISPDSSALHIAGALEKPCLAVFGNLPPFLRTKYYPTVKSLYPEGELFCVPCYDFSNPCIHYKDLPTLNQPVGAECMRLLTPERLFYQSKKYFELVEETQWKKKNTVSVKLQRKPKK